MVHLGSLVDSLSMCNALHSKIYDANNGGACQYISFFSILPVTLRLVYHYKLPATLCHSYLPPQHQFTSGTTYKLHFFVLLVCVLWYGPMCYYFILIHSAIRVLHVLCSQLTFALPLRCLLPSTASSPVKKQLLSWRGKRCCLFDIFHPHLWLTKNALLCLSSNLTPQKECHGVSLGRPGFTFLIVCRGQPIFSFIVKKRIYCKYVIVQIAHEVRMHNAY